MTAITHSTRFSPTASIGAKAGGLLFLQENGFRVPDFYVLDFELLQAITAQPDQLATVLANWKTQFGIAGDALWAVRSSAAVEDGNQQSFAGLFASEVNIPTSELETAIQHVLARFQAAGQLDYHTGGTFAYGIILQQMIRSEYAGVAFSHNPLNVTEAAVHLNVIPGIGENLVSGKEEAFAIREDGKTLHFESPEETYHGDVYTDQLVRVAQTGEQITENIRPFLTELIAGTKRLAQLKQHPVDIEFTIAGGQLFWLQVRPITTLPQEIPVIWDNTAAEGNYPGITLPLTLSFVRRSFSEAYGSMALFLGMGKTLVQRNKPFLDQMSGGIDGGLYYNVTSWQQLLSQLPFGLKAARLLPKMWGMDDAAFVPAQPRLPFFIRLRMLLRLLRSFAIGGRLKRRYLRLYSAVEQQFEQTDLSQLSGAELRATYRDIEHKLGSNWSAPMVNGFFTLVFFQLLKRTVAQSPIAERYPNFVNDILFGQGDVISVTIVRAFQQLVKTIQQDAQLSAVFALPDPQQITSELEQKHAAFYAEIQHYIALYGDRSDESELKLEQPSFRDEPLRFLAYLKEHAAIQFQPAAASQTPSYRIILQTIYPRSFLRRWWLLFLIRQTIARIRDRENFRFIRTRTFAMIRRIFRQLDAVYLQQGLIEQPGDLLYLELEELENPESAGFAATIARRKQEYAAYATTERATRYHETKRGFEAVENDLSDATGRTLSGTGCCSGIVTAPVAIIDEHSDPLLDYSGRIVVAQYFEPGKIALFSQAAGVISVRGNLLSHTAILCREMGIPSIVGAKGLLHHLTDGTVITMNGATGKITFTDHED